MATNKNITMKQYNGTDYDTLYPKTKVEQVEGAYTQQQILADSTKTLYGLPNTAVPDDVLALIKTLVDNAQNSADGKAIVAYGSYNGTGAYGSGSPNTLTFDSKPLLLAILPNASMGSSVQSFMAVRNSQIVYTFAEYFQSMCTVTWGEKSVSWYNGSATDYQFNRSNTTYHYVALLVNE